MNIFYAPPEQIYAGQIELAGQEAKHASKVMRYRVGDAITIVDGKGGWYDCEIRQINKNIVTAGLISSRRVKAQSPETVLAMGLLKKRDRLEFAVEKAVELGVSEIALFRSRHSVKENVRMDRLEKTVLSAMKQSLQAWLPKVYLYNSLKEVIKHYEEHDYLLAHENTDAISGIPDEVKEHSKLLLLVGPEGGFSKSEIEVAIQQNAKLISLGKNRLRTETAAIAFLSQFIFKI